MVEDWLEEYRVHEELFSNAYETVPPDQRGLVKKHIAQLHTLLGQHRTLAATTQLHYPQGFVVSSWKEPLETVWVVFYSAKPYPAQLISMLMTLRMSHTGQLGLVAVHDHALNDISLTGIELCGIEHVFTLPEKMASAFFTQALSESQSNAMFVFLTDDNFTEHSPWLQHDRVIHKNLMTRAAVWSEPGVGWNKEALHLASPSCEYHWYGPANEPLPDHWEQVEGDFERLVKEGYPMVYLPTNVNLAALNNAAVVLGPGQEFGCFWQDLSSMTFANQTIAFFDTPQV